MGASWRFSLNRKMIGSNVNVCVLVLTVHVSIRMLCRNLALKVLVFKVCHCGWEMEFRTAKVLGAPRLFILGKGDISATPCSNDFYPVGYAFVDLPIPRQINVRLYRCSYLMSLNVHEVL